MKSIKDSLISNEKIVYEAQISWCYFIMPAFCAFIGLVFMFVSPWFPDFVSKYVLLLGLLSVAVAALQAALRYIEIINTEIIITNLRVIVKTGILHQKVYEIRHTLQESIYLNQSALGYLLNYGSVFVTGSGGETAAARCIKDPFEFKQVEFKEASSQIAEIKAGQ